MYDSFRRRPPVPLLRVNEMRCVAPTGRRVFPVRLDSPDLSSPLPRWPDPTRRAILVRLARGEATVNELAEPFSISLQAISKHLKVLERAGLITRGRDAQRRPCRIEVAPLETAADWIERYREIAKDRFDRLDQEIQKIQRKQKGDNHGRD